MAELTGAKKEIAFGSQIRSYTFHPQQRIKDHRTNLEIGNVEAVMDGDIDEFIKAYPAVGAERRGVSEHDGNELIRLRHEKLDGAAPARRRSLRRPAIRSVTGPARSRRGWARPPRRSCGRWARSAWPAASWPCATTARRASRI